MVYTETVSFQILTFKILSWNNLKKLMTFPAPKIPEWVQHYNQKYIYWLKKIMHAMELDEMQESLANIFYAPKSSFQSNCIFALNALNDVKQFFYQPVSCVSNYKSSCIHLPLAVSLEYYFTSFTYFPLACDHFSNFPNISSGETVSSAVTTTLLSSKLISTFLTPII